MTFKPHLEVHCKYNKATCFPAIIEDVCDECGDALCNQCGYVVKSFHEDGTIDYSVHICNECRNKYHISDNEKVEPKLNSQS